MRREDLKSRIVALIDDSRDDSRKALFYSDPEVSALLDELHRRWEDSGRSGEPIDYASLDELRLLYSKALGAASAAGRGPPGPVLRGAFWWRRSEEGEEGRGITGRLRRILRWVIGGWL